MKIAIQNIALKGEVNCLKHQDENKSTWMA